MDNQQNLDSALRTLKQQRASEINWGIFCVMGMQKLLEAFHSRRMISPSVYSRLYIALDDAVEDMYTEHAANGYDGKRSRREASRR